MKKQVFLALILPLFAFQWALSSNSVAGFFPLENSGRQVWNFNNGWRFLRADAPDAWRADYDDSAWEIVATPHTVQLMPAEASGTRNFQGVVWYRKKFVVPADAAGKDFSLHFEAIMGKQKIYVNGQLAAEHFGGYTPITVRLNEWGVRAGETCVVAVMADNGNDRNYPPGKPQFTLDFSYHGGIYRDVWLIAKNKVAITDAVEANKVAGGGVFVYYDNISEQSADVFVNTELKNNGSRAGNFVLEAEIRDAAGKVVRTMSSRVQLKAKQAFTVKMRTKIQQPQLWSPNAPHLYQLSLRIKQGNVSLDGGVVRMGIRKAEFRGKEGFFLNNKPYGQLIGANRHQDFAYVGNAVPNSQQWRDAKRLRDAGCTIIRTAHYPMDPSFMDACDELGIFVIVATPGWQYWNKDPLFAERVHATTRKIIRRDRNHPSVILWEPILNETRFPLDFSMQALQITRDEYPFPGAPGAAADLHSEGVAEHYDVVYGWPSDEGKVNKPIFCREFAENVDDWYAHNNNNRASRSWGERPMRVQALSHAVSYGEMFHGNGQFVGGALWHPFDHQRGYHPDPYWGGIFDAFRQPKYSYHLFKSQVYPHLQIKKVATGPMVYVMNEMTAFSEPNVVVFSNCDSVRLTIYEGRSITLPVVRSKKSLPYAPVVFENVWNFWEARELSYVQKNWQKVSFLVEGIIDGKVVCSEKKMPSRRSTKLRLYIDEAGRKLEADGSDFVVVVAEVTDDSGNVRRLAKENIQFSVAGEGEIIGDAHIGANPRAVEWGSAPILVRSTTKAGKITVKAKVLFEGTHAPTAAEIEFESIPAKWPLNYIEKSNVENQRQKLRNEIQQMQLSDEEKKKLLDEVERQQTDFGEKHKARE